MRLLVAGGVGEYGRNCFLLKGESVCFLVDCGSMAGEEASYPRLTANEIRRVRYVFLTHANKERSGSLDWLYASGFQGFVIAAAEALRQLNRSDVPMLALERLASASPLERGLKVFWGRSGHCPGAVWYDFEAEGRRVVFSGDYGEEGLLYACDRLEGRYADVAVLDSASGEENATALRSRFVEALRPEACNLLPVPRYGRGMEMAVFLAARLPDMPLWADEHFLRQLQKPPVFWLRRGVEEALAQLRVRPLAGGKAPEGCLFLSSPQMDDASAQALAERVLAGGGRILLTGRADAGSEAERLLEAGRAIFRRWPARLSDSERRRVEARNRFRRVVSRQCAEHALATREIEL